MPIVQTVGTAVHAQDAQAAQRLEQALAQAIRQALDDGVAITDTAELLRRQAAARARVS